MRSWNKTLNLVAKTITLVKIFHKLTEHKYVLKAHKTRFKRLQCRQSEKNVYPEQINMCLRTISEIKSVVLKTTSAVKTITL